MLKTVLISTYELGRQPFGLASPAAWLRARGVQVTCIDVSREQLHADALRDAGLIAFYVPMHTATRLAIELLSTVRRINPSAHVCFYGLYAPVNESYLRELGVQTILGGEFEEALANLASQLVAEEGGSEPTGAINWGDRAVISLSRLKFQTPDRTGLLPLERYAHLLLPSGEHRVVGYTEASRGCKHLCRHCPIVPVYNGVFRIIDHGVVLEDIRRQVAAGAQHITFGDPDFFNGIGHAIPLIERLHGEFPQLTYDATIKIEHLLKYGEHLRTLRETGCLFVTSAVESVDDGILEKLDKGHTRADFLEVVSRFRETGLILQPTFVPFTPWTTVQRYCDLLDLLRHLSLIENVAPVQLSIRLLIPAGSRLLELQDIHQVIGAYDQAALVYPWKHDDPRVDALSQEVQSIIQRGEKMGLSRASIFDEITKASFRTAGRDSAPTPLPVFAKNAAVPHMSEPWYCCSEPTGDQLAAIDQLSKPEKPLDIVF